MWEMAVCRKVQFDSNVTSVLFKNSNNLKTSSTLGLYLNDILDLSDGDASLMPAALNSQTVSSNIPQPNAVSAKSAGKIILNNKDRKMWEVNLGSPIYSFPIVYKDKAYIGCKNGTLNALDVKDGHVLWSYNVKDGHTPHISINDGTVYSLWGTGDLYALRADNGEKIWSKKIGAPFLDHDYVRQSPFVSNNIVYVFGSGTPKTGSISPIEPKDPAKIYALDAKTGKEIWNVKIKSWLPGSSPFESGGIVYFWNPSAGLGGEMSALSAKNGKELWARPFHSFMPNVSEYNKVLYLGDRNGKMHAVDGLSGKTLWAKDVSADICYPTAADGMVYTVTSDGDVCALNADNGSTIWQTPAAPIRYYPVYSKGVVYIGTEHGNIYALDGKDGKKLWEFKTGDNIFGSPFIYKDTVYVGTKSGKVYAVMNDQACYEKSLDEELKEDAESKDSSYKIEIGDEWVIIGTTKIPVQER